MPTEDMVPEYLMAHLSFLVLVLVLLFGTEI